MPKDTQYTRVPDLPFIQSLQGARLDALHEETLWDQRDFIIDYQEFCPAEPAQIINDQGKLSETIRGHWAPRRLRLTQVQTLTCEGLYTKLNHLPVDHPGRSLRGVLCWIPPEQDSLFSLFYNGSDEPGKLWALSAGWVQEARSGEPEPYHETRDWSPAPTFRPGIIPEPKALRQRYGGDPVTFRLGSQAFHRRLFVGSIEYQTDQRPQVDAVLNVGEEPSRWVKTDRLHPNDRAIVHGEGSQGMRLDQVTEEATWVIDRLRQGQRVLIHCVAGLNRSTTVCCAVLMLLEGLSAEAALERVRKHHAWARPDTHHWLVLKALK